MLLGERVFNLPLGNVTRTHLGLAKRVLERFDVVLIMETMSDAGGTASLQHGLGWGGVTIEKRHVAGKQQKQKLSLEALPEADRAVLEANNVLDTELYAYARELHALDTEFYALVGGAQHARLLKRTKEELHCAKRCGWACQPDWKDWNGQFGGAGHTT